VKRARNSKQGREAASVRAKIHCQPRAQALASFQFFRIPDESLSFFSIFAERRMLAAASRGIP
jgi:hypothetical protein